MQGDLLPPLVPLLYLPAFILYPPNSSDTMASSPRRLSLRGVVTLLSSPTQDAQLLVSSSSVGPARGFGAGAVKKAPTSMAAVLVELVIFGGGCALPLKGRIAGW